MEVFMKHYTWTMKQGLVFLTVGLVTLGSTTSAFAKSTSDKIKGGIDTTAEALKKGVDKTGDALDDAKAGVKKGAKKFGEKVEDLQTYFRKKFHDQVTVESTTLSEVTFNGHHMAAVVKPGERIEGQFKCTFNKDEIKDVKYHSMLIGFKGREKAETSVDIGRGILINEENQASFTLIAPSEPGFYKVRFRPITGYFGGDVLNEWKDKNGAAPNSESTIGLIYVRQ
jgi:hypothetical protein